MNITDVLVEMKLNEGLFTQGDFKDKKGLVSTATNTIYKIFSKPVAEELISILDKVKLKTFSLLSPARSFADGYTNTSFMNDRMDYLDRHKEEYRKNPNRFNRATERIEKRVQKNLNNQKIVINPDMLRSKGVDKYSLTFIHEMIHAAYPYSKNLVKACENIYNIFKENWNESGGTFYISKILRGTMGRENSSSLKSEILPYIITDNIHTEYLTEEGTYKLINYLKNCGLLNVGEFWDNKFQKMIEANKKGLNSLRKNIYKVKKTLNLPGKRSD